MYPVLLHIYGPFFIHSYGVAIAIGLAAFYRAVIRHPQCQYIITHTQFHALINYGILLGIIGGRAFHIINEWQSYTHTYEFLEFWQGGFSIAGSLLSILMGTYYYLIQKNIAVLPFFDLCALYAPLLEIAGRIGCFFAGCCYGLPTHSMLGVTYCHPQVYAPLHVPLHPTQLYTAGALLLALLLIHVLYIYKPRIFTIGQGYLCALYLILSNLVRFSVDFLRADRVFISTISRISVYQIIALTIIVLTSISMIIIMYKRRILRLS